MEEIISDEIKALELLKEYDSKIGGQDNKHKRQYAEMCDYAHHLEFHSRGYQVPHSTVLASNTTTVPAGSAALLNNFHVLSLKSRTNPVC